VSITDELLENTAGHAWAFTHGALPLPPAKRVAVLACMDACLNVQRIQRLEEPDAGVIRTAAGVVSDDAIGSPLASQRLLGIGEIVLIHHTDYGMLTFGDDEVKAAVGAETGLTPPFALEAFADLTGTSAGRWRRLRRAIGAAHGRRPRLRLRGCHGVLRRCWTPRRDIWAAIDPNQRNDLETDWHLAIQRKEEPHEPCGGLRPCREAARLRPS
jgi:carbonic anhydrase